LKEIAWYVANPPKYVFGGKIQKSGGKITDCSDFVFNCFLNAGFLVSYVPAKEMAKGLGGWGRIWHSVDIFDTKELDTIFYTFTTNRINGHVSIVIYDPKSKLFMVAHASESHGKVVLVAPTGTMLNCITEARRINE